MVWLTSYSPSKEQMRWKESDEGRGGVAKVQVAGTSGRPRSWVVEAIYGIYYMRRCIPGVESGRAMYMAILYSWLISAPDGHEPVAQSGSSRGSSRQTSRRRRLCRQLISFQLATPVIARYARWWSYCGSECGKDSVANTITEGLIHRRCEQREAKPCYRAEERDSRKCYQLLSTGVRTMTRLGTYLTQHVL